MDEETPAWVRDGFNAAARHLMNLPLAGIDPSTCPHADVVPLAAAIDGKVSRRISRFGRCVACRQSIRLFGAA